MAANQIVPLFGGVTTKQGASLGSAVSRQLKRETDLISARTEIVAITEQAHAFLTAQAMNNISVLVSQAEAQMKVNPTGAQFYESLIASYAIGAGQRISRL